MTIKEWYDGCVKITARASKMRFKTAYSADNNHISVFFPNITMICHYNQSKRTFTTDFIQIELNGIVQYTVFDYNEFMDKALAIINDFKEPLI
jgi:hypothetical protein